jgi:sigma-B regulation protein RsbU (phosphoserine phosphatase)
LGILPHASLYDGTVRMRPGDVLVLYTDGVTDVTNVEGESFDSWRLQQVVEANHTASAQGIVTAIHDAIRQFAGSAPLADDLTLIVVKRHHAQGGA